MSEFTHDFKFNLNGNVYTGQIEFNDDGIASWQFDESYGLTIQQMEKVNLQMRLWHDLYHQFGEVISLIKLKDKNEEE